MGIQATSTVWKYSKSRMADRLVLLAIAEHANDSGRCWPSTSRLAEMTGLDIRSIRRSVTRLIALGELEADRRGGKARSSKYRILLPILGRKQPCLAYSNPDANAPNPDRNDTIPGRKRPPNRKEPSRNGNLSNEQLIRMYENQH